MKTSVLRRFTHRRHGCAPSYLPFKSAPVLKEVCLSFLRQPTHAASKALSPDATLWPAFCKSIWALLTSHNLLVASCIASLIQNHQQRRNLWETASFKAGLGFDFLTTPLIYWSLLVAHQFIFVFPDLSFKATPLPPYRASSQFHLPFYADLTLGRQFSLVL